MTDGSRTVGFSKKPKRGVVFKKKTGDGVGVWEKNSQKVSLILALRFVCVFG